MALYEDALGGFSGGILFGLGAAVVAPVVVPLAAPVLRPVAVMLVRGALAVGNGVSGFVAQISDEFGNQPSRPLAARSAPLR